MSHTTRLTAFMAAAFALCAAGDVQAQNPQTKVQAPRPIPAETQMRQQINEWTVGLAGGLLEGAPIRLAIDAVGGSQIVRFGDALADEATVLNYGRLSGENPQLSGHQCVFKRLVLTGFWLVPWLQKLSRQEVAALYAGLARRMADGTLRIPVEKTFGLEEIKEAVALANAYRRGGKVLVTPNGPIN